MHLFRMQRLAAFRAHHHRIEQLAARLVFVQQWAAALVAHVGIAPMHHRHDDRIEIEPLLRDLLMPPSAVADSYWQLYQQPKSAWTFEMEIRPFGEKW